MKMTLLEMVQDILSDMDSDEVNSISDTVESLQVAKVVKSSYEALIVGLELPEHQSMVELEALTDDTRPNYLRVPDTVREIRSFSYDYDTDGETDYHLLRYLEPDQFMQRTQNSNSGSRIEVEDFSGVRIWCRDDANPTYYTSFDDEYIVTDSYNSALENTLQTSKSLAYALVEPTFTFEDTFIPDLSSHMFPLLLSKAKSKCFTVFKQMANPDEAQESRRQLVRQQSRLWKAQQRNYKRFPDYGRRRR